MLWRRKSRPDEKLKAQPRKLLAWAAAVGLIVGITDVGLLMEDMLRATRNSLHSHPASGDIVFVKIDDRSVREMGRWPWPRRHHAELTDRLTQAGAERIVFDIMFESKSSAEDDRLFAEALANSGRVVLPVRTHPGMSETEDHLGIVPAFAKNADLATLSVIYNYQNAAWKIPYGLSHGGREFSSLAAKLADRTGPVNESFPADYSIDPLTIPTASAVDVLSGAFTANEFDGKTVIVGTASEAIGDQYFIPGVGKMAGAYLHVIGAETLKSGTPRDFGWIPVFLLSVLMVSVAVLRKRQVMQNAILMAYALTVLLLPAVLEPQLLFFNIIPGLSVVLTVGIALAWRRFRQRGFVDTVSGLPNLTALREHKAGRDKTLIAARVINYSEIVTALPADGERHLVEQIIARLSIGSAKGTFYKGDGGIFAWFEHSRSGIAHHIEALASLFRNPLRVGNLSIDLAVSFGVDIGSSRSLSNRLGSAVLAAEEAANEGLKWKYYDPETLQNASWKLSMLSQLDTAIDHGEVWIAFQPKLDLANRRVIGAEALARWTHPEKGPIAATEFVAAAEQHDRIGKLTEFVLEKAIAAAATIHRRGHEFDIAVNLSGRLLGDKKLAHMVAGLLDLHGLAPDRLTLELTETAAISGGGDALDILASLRELGVRISIDDYGTGLSTLDYLKKIPATEIKIDQTFVKGMQDNRSDRVMVQSTIALAHSLGRTVVAEGVEQNSTLEMLARMRCDIAQGYIVGRPMSLDSLIKRLASDQNRDVA